MQLSEILNRRNSILLRIYQLEEDMAIINQKLQDKKWELEILDSVDLFRENRDGVMHPSVGFIPLHPETQIINFVEESAPITPEQYDAIAVGGRVSGDVPASVYSCPVGLTLNEKHQQVYNKHFPAASMEIMKQLDNIS